MEASPPNGLLPGCALVVPASLLAVNLQPFSRRLGQIRQQRAYCNLGWTRTKLLVSSSKVLVMAGVHVMPRFQFRKIETPFLAGIILAIGYLDYKSGFMFSLFPLYLIPLVIVAWHDTKAVTAVIAFLAATIVFLKDTFARQPHNGAIYFYWDEVVKILLLLAVSYGVWKIKKLLVERAKANAELRQALSEIKELRQMIPICAWCHSIRNDRGFYERIEVYLSKITGADFTHGICPDCLKKYYGHLGRDEQQESPEQKEEPK
jgi:hypothetical protein